ncbi:hypothetical protein GGI25_001845 [Coemansia spiralis]|uniref:carboxypeptidase C n=2 Tax=Coemansia TaxID=4863 RepID=A0A9W8KY29_9FUNG|nr:hypothetical protein EDC05_001860 [Coemansia umbellata]KAJ2622714.1 hypothetical protein GGI26_002983 [Coemansia sp. RSA 1358]KAJ2679073.1 hypothetical protein GGI25_001845 [Coemansia spiralis]
MIVTYIISLLVWLLVCDRRSCAEDIGTEGLKASQLVCDPSVKQHSGYIDVAANKHLFYWFFEARSPQIFGQHTPLVLWLNGGPGCSSMSGLLGGIGPCRVDENGQTVLNAHSWNSRAHLLFLDQPTNVGYSYGTNVSTTWEAASDVVTFLHMFYAQHPEYKGELHVMGESYAAHYIPAIAAQIVAGSQSPWRLPLASIAVGNGLFDMSLQYRYLHRMACHSRHYPTMVNTTTCEQMQSATTRFEQSIRVHQLERTQETAVNATYTGFEILTPYQWAGRNPYDVRKPCGSASLCDPYMDRISAFANQQWVRSSLGVRTQAPFLLCSQRVQALFIDSGDEMADASGWLGRVLRAGVRVLNYAGDADLICNWLGNKALSVRWAGQAGLLAADRVWGYRGRAAGEVRSMRGLAFLRIYGAGHMVALDQPETALEMLRQWIDRRL